MEILNAQNMSIWNVIIKRHLNDGMRKVEKICLWGEKKNLLGRRRRLM